jgi:hypothetical protein
MHHRNKHQPGATILLVTLAVMCLTTSPAPCDDFIRGNSNVSGTADLTDALHFLEVAVLGQGEIHCVDAADSDDSGDLTINDPIFLLTWVFLGGVEIADPLRCGPDPTLDFLDCGSFEACPQNPLDEEIERASHLLNRIAYGPSIPDLTWILENDSDAYVEQQLQPETIEETSAELVAYLDVLTESRLPANDTALLRRGSSWRTFKGTSRPPEDWNQPGFDPTSWELSVTPIGFAQPYLATELDDMHGSDISVFVRRPVLIDNLSVISTLFLSVSYEAGFVAYLNGTILMLTFLFLGGTPHVLAVPGEETSGCVVIPGCLRGNGCSSNP